MKINTILKRLLQLYPKSVDQSLHRIKRLLKDLNNPEKKIKNPIQVIGTNGKFSICSTLREIFETAGYSLNMYISPSLRKFNERYYFSGKQITDDKLYELLNEVEVINKNRPITFHEIITAAFYLEAERSMADLNIIESGALFRLDASNVLDKNIASVISSIGIDHKDFLKKGTIDEIIYEKCSSLLNNSKIIVSEQSSKKILNKIKETIKLNSSQKIIYGEHFKFKKTTEGFNYIDDSASLLLPQPNLLGEHQYTNISTAVATIKQLNQFDVSDTHIISAVTKIRSEGRLQKILSGKLRKYVSNKTEIIIDGGHNELAAKVISSFIISYTKDRNVYMILGMMFNKDHPKYIIQFKNRVKYIYTVNIPNQKNCIKNEELAKIVTKCGIDSESSDDVKKTLKKISSKDPGSLIMICGSLYLAGELLNIN